LGGEDPLQTKGGKKGGRLFSTAKEEIKITGARREGDRNAATLQREEKAG